ncbi:MAG: hypothetical protein M3220_22385 [Chloroflexota bacterium]|nr:hypothetical protein [Chloroflexota bacterium]
MTDMGAGPPPPDSARQPVSPQESTGAAPQPEAEERTTVYADKEAPRAQDPDTELEEARAIAEELMRARFSEELRNAQTADPDAAPGMAKELATLVLARMSVPADTDLHEAIFRMARDMVAAEHPAVDEGDVGDMGVPLS